PAPLFGTNLKEIGADDTQKAHGVAIGHTHTFSPNTLNEFRLGYNRAFAILRNSIKEPLFEQFGIRGIPPEPNVTGLSTLSISGFSDVGNGSFLPAGKISEVFQGIENLSFIRGNHSIKTGFNLRHVRSWWILSGQAGGQFQFTGVFTQDPQKRATTGSGWSDFLLGLAGNAGLTNYVQTDIRWLNGGFYIQDDWKVNPRLTLNLGLRYEIFTQPRERHDVQANVLVEQGKLIYANNNIPDIMPRNLVTTIPQGIDPQSLMITDTNNFAPRVGFAYQLAPRTVLRAAGGVFYADHPHIGALNRLPSNPPFRLNTTFPTDQINPRITLGNGFPSDTLSLASASDLRFNRVDFDFPQSLASHWSLDIQHEFRGILLDAGYSGTKGSQLPVVTNWNAPLPGPGSVASRRPIQGLGDIINTQSMANSNYHSLQVRAERRFAQGLGLLASYTLGKSIDQGGDELAGEDQLYRNPRDVFGDRALSLFDMRQRLVITSIWDLPLGKGRRWDLGSPVLNAILGSWQVNNIATFRGGQPFTPILNFNSANTGAARPNRIRDGNLPNAERTLQRYFDTAAFPAATQFNFGNAGKNILFGPGAVNFDFSLFKRVPAPFLGEQGAIQFRVEAFNLFNTPQFGIPNRVADNPQGGTITSLVSNMRELQLGLKILF
ncbi:MAG: TonB-dependent receptor, partial [Acidobacteria bacterium]|nr:TonB-dependent receptor [Acidobacteriota bacterium]